jgi:hypothetical protein
MSLWDAKRLQNEFPQLVPMQHLFGLDGLMDVLNAEFDSDHDNFAAIPACLLHIKTGGLKSENSVRCIAEFVAPDELERLHLCRYRSNPSRCVDEYEHIERKVVQELVRQKQLVVLDENEQQARRRCGMFNLTSPEWGATSLYEWIRCMAPLTRPVETEAALLCRANRGACEDELKAVVAGIIFCVKRSF